MNSNISRPLRIALTKGRLEKDTVALLEKLGYDCTAVHEKGRKLILPVGDDIEVVQRQRTLLPPLKTACATMAW